MNVLMAVQMACVGVMAGVVILFALAATVFRRKWGHDVLGWHDCDVEGPDGASATGRCRYCVKECTMDGQGNWV